MSDVRKQRLGGVGVHVWSGDGGAVADGLRGVFVGRGAIGAVVGSVNLGKYDHVSFGEGE